ncbi:MAG: hypothetical protein NC302_01835 [Bacteroidales bacterium]|nr:hypothetical protein [Bacteroidales bacterium]MCM1416889.1 hypothetical protein [bacterium]MCM1422405.1 hypothetical protein [bacterium]
MLEQAGSMFDDMEAMLNRIRKKVYEERMTYFCEKNAQLLAEMTGYVERAKEQSEAETKEQVQRRDEAAAQSAKAFVDAVEARFAGRGKISGRTQMDLNLFMIYYVFPAILLTESVCAEALADAVRDEWRARFGDGGQIDYASFAELNDSFRKKFLGLF